MTLARKRTTIGALMLLVAVSALVFWALEYSQRAHVVFANRNPVPVRDVTLTYAGRVEHLGPVAPNCEVEFRIALSYSETLHVAWTRQGRPGEDDKRIEAPGVGRSSKGGPISIVDGTR